VIWISKESVAFTLAADGGWTVLVAPPEKPNLSGVPGEKPALIAQTSERRLHAFFRQAPEAISSSPPPRI